MRSLLFSVSRSSRSARRAAAAAFAAVAGLAETAGGAVASTAELGQPGSGGRREMSTDRPDATESPFTIEPGHVQVEMDFCNASRDQQDGVCTIAWEAAPINLRCGLTRNWEAGFFVVPFRRVSETPRGGRRETHAGPGDATLRTKFNFRGNDGGGLATGIIADLKLPTATRTLGNGKCEGALTFPVSLDFAAGWSAGAMTSIEAIYTDAGRYRPGWTNTVTLGHELTEKVGCFVEVTSSVGGGAHVAMFNAGLTWAPGPDVQIDGGVNLGLTRAAPDAGFFAGISRRF